MKKLIQRKYDHLFQPGWRPALQSRRDLVTWACNQYNQKLEAQSDSSDLIDCQNYQALLFEFGPNYDSLKKKLGHVRGLFD